MGMRAHDNSAIARGRDFGAAAAGPIGSDAVAGTGRCQSTPRRNYDVCYRRGIHEMDVLGSRLPNSAAAPELVYFVWRGCASASAFGLSQWHCDRMAGQLPGRRIAICNQFRGATHGAHVSGILCTASCSGRRLRSTSLAVHPGRDVFARHRDHLQLLQSYNTGTQYATVDVLDSLWNHLVGTVMPIAAVLALVGAILNFATRKPFLRLVAVSLAMLTVSAIWKLLTSMM